MRHLLSRIPPECSNQPLEIRKLILQNDRIYSHATLRINYTSYDVRRQQDVVNPRTPCCFVLLPADTTDDPTGHPFLYAQVLGIYHAHVRYSSRPPKRMEFLWVRWLDYDEEEPGGWDTGRMDRVSYGKCRNDDELLDAYDFIDPKDIVRACHLIPDFDSGTASTLNVKPGSLTSDNEEREWKFHYVNRWVNYNLI
jgi:hypothetical protein